jgi:hypothetical protein
MPNTYICISLAFLVTKREPSCEELLDTDVDSFVLVYAGSFLAMLNSRERTNKRVSELFTSKNSWRRSLKIVSNSSASLFGPRSDMSGEVSGVLVDQENYSIGSIPRRQQSSFLRSQLSSLKVPPIIAPRFRECQTRSRC